ncbi:MAG: tetratricopeptide repeat protein [Pirellulaceae bacterium]
MPAIEALLQTSIEAHEAGDLRLAAEGFAAVLAVAPELPDAWYNAGLVAFQSGQNDQAIAALERAAALQPEPEYLTDLAAIYQTIGDDSRADQLLSTAIAIDSDYGPAHFHRGVVLSSQNRFDEALLHLHRAIDLDYGVDSSLQQIGLVYDRAGDSASAIQAYESALAINPQLTHCLERISHYSILGTHELNFESITQVEHLGTVFAQCPSHRQRGAKLLVAAGLFFEQSEANETRD